MIVQRLTNYIWVGLDSILNESHITNVARIFYALNASLQKLDSYYEKVQPTSGSPIDSRYFPSITAYPDGDGFIDFKYIGFLETAPTAPLFELERPLNRLRISLLNSLTGTGKEHTTYLLLKV